VSKKFLPTHSSLKVSYSTNDCRVSPKIIVSMGRQEPAAIAETKKLYQTFVSFKIF
jgi:hypothetical protein